MEGAFTDFALSSGEKAAHGDIVGKKVPRDATRDRVSADADLELQRR